MLPNTTFNLSSALPLVGSSACITSARPPLESTIDFCRTKPALSFTAILAMLLPPLRVIWTDAESTAELSFVALSLYETVSVIATNLELSPKTSSVLLSIPPTYLSNSNFVSPETLQESVTESPLLATEAAEVEKELIDGLPL